jgi:hypothetical protein
VPGSDDGRKYEIDIGATCSADHLYTEMAAYRRRTGSAALRYEAGMAIDLLQQVSEAVDQERLVKARLHVQG